MGLPLFFLSPPQSCIRHNWPHHSPESSRFQFRHHGFLSQLALILSVQKVFFSHFWLLFLFHITLILWCSIESIFDPILFTIDVSPFTSTVSSCGINKQQYADDTQLFVFLSPASLSSSLCSLQRCVFYRRKWFIQNGIVLNPTKTKAICFGTSRGFRHDDPSLWNSSLIISDLPTLTLSSKPI